MRVKTSEKYFHHKDIPLLLEKHNFIQRESRLLMQEAVTENHIKLAYWTIGLNIQFISVLVYEGNVIIEDFLIDYQYIDDVAQTGYTQSLNYMTNLYREEHNKVIDLQGKLFDIREQQLQFDLEQRNISKLASIAR